MFNHPLTDLENFAGLEFLYFPVQVSKWLKRAYFAEVYLEPSRTSTMEFFCENSLYLMFNWVVNTLVSFHSTTFV